MSIPDAAQGAKDHLADTTHDWARDLDAGHLDALSQWVVHTNLRREGAWTQRYERGIAVTGLTPIPGDGTTGTMVHFLPDAALLSDVQIHLPEPQRITVAFGAHLTVEIVDDHG